MDGQTYRQIEGLMYFIDPQKEIWEFGTFTLALHNPKNEEWG